MIVMRGATQANWLHSVPKRAHAEGRINITFRRAMNTAGTNKWVLALSRVPLMTDSISSVTIGITCSLGRFIDGQRDR
jgi:hypothetical protein